MGKIENCDDILKEWILDEFNVYIGECVKFSNPGLIAGIGSNHIGQLGMGSDVYNVHKPKRVLYGDTDIVQVCAGGMHSAILTSDGEVYTFGCDDENALGRRGDNSVPGKVVLHEKIVMISAGDSHTAVLSDKGDVYAWGTFRDSKGPIGILDNSVRPMSQPCHIRMNMKIKKIVSGNDHLVMLSENGQVCTMGVGEQGQLGRDVDDVIKRRFLKTPGIVMCRDLALICNDVWANSYTTFAKDVFNNVYGWGLNGSYQIGDIEYEKIKRCGKPGIAYCIFTPVVIDSSKNNWIMISSGSDHTLFLNDKGQVFSQGMKRYGQLGLGVIAEETIKTPTRLKTLHDIKSVNSVGSISYAIDTGGRVFSWGMGSTMQLGRTKSNDGFSSVEEDSFEPKLINLKRKCLMISGGGQHTLLLLAHSDMINSS